MIEINKNNNTTKWRDILRDCMYKFVDLDAATQFSNCADNAIRLVEGNSFNQGRLEVCVNSAWGSVCDSAGVFTSDEAKVVCRQLGILQVEGKTLPTLLSFIIVYTFA